MLLTLADFLDSVVHSALIVGLAMALGGAVFERAVLGWASPPVPEASRRRCLALIATGAGLLAGAQLAGLVLTTVVLRSSLAEVGLIDLLSATNIWVAVFRAALAVALASIAVWARSNVSRAFAPIALSLAAIIALSGAWLTHAVGRLESRGLLMTLTVVHQGAAAVWLGGLVQLGALWRLSRRDPDVDALWPVAVPRFSRLATGAVVLVLAAALPLTWLYTRTLSGLIGTGYGSLLALKALLLLVALPLAALNMATARRVSTRVCATLRGRLPTLVEGETMLLVVLVFAATGLSALPPPADQPPDEQATVSEVADVFRPKLPSLATPSLAAMRHADAAPGAPRSREAYLWSNFSHNAAGVMLLAMALVSLTGPVFGARFSRHWPLGLLAMAAFVYLRASANEGTWPFGTTPIAHVDAEGVQHRLAAVLVLVMGILEWRARRSCRGMLRYVFPALCVLGAALLLTHSHRQFQPKEGYLVQVTHSAMGALAGLVAVGRWLELRLPPRPGRVAGIMAGLAMLGIALVLVFYREGNVVN